MIINRLSPKEMFIERQIAIGIITSTSFLKRVLPIYRPELIQSELIRKTIEWSLDYYERYQQSPGKEIEDIFQAKELDSDFGESIENFLTNISDEYERQDSFNIDYILDKAEQYFRLSSIRNLKNDLAGAISAGEVIEAENIINRFSKIARPSTKGIDLIEDTEVIQEIFSRKKIERLFYLPGELGKAIGSLDRGFLLGIMGVSGIGKTWWLQFISQQALFKGLNVLFVSLEMSEKQIISRFYQMLLGKRGRNKKEVLSIPVFDCGLNQNNECIDYCQVDSFNSEYFPCTKCRGRKNFSPSVWHKKVKRGEITIADITRKAKQIKGSSILRKAHLRIVDYPSGTLTPTALKSYLEHLELTKNFIPDAIVTDYADKFLAELNKNKEIRHRINEIWEFHKALAQERHCLVVTASQSNTAREGKDSGRGSWSEDIRKLELIDIGLALNQTLQEKKQGIMRVNVLKQRHDDFDVTEDVTVLYEYGIGKPYLDSLIMPHN